MGFLEDRDLSDVPTIPDYYRGKTVFITGGSGFIGKVLIEKLLYSCTELDRIYLLMRSKKGVKSEDRLSQIYSSACFDRLRNEKPGVFNTKVFIINGDVVADGLGLSIEDRSLLVNRVNIILHIAASVRFDDPLSYAAKMNLTGTVQIVDLAKETRHLNALVHVSTSYCNTIRHPIKEVMYPPHADWRDTLQVCTDVDDHTLRVLTPKYLGELPNTYTFTKQLAEHVVYEQRGQLPAVIVRPSVVISALKEPMPGWIDNFNGPVGIFIAAGKGILRCAHLDADIKLDLIPVDICVKNIIASAWIRGTKKFEPSDEIPVYNCCSKDQLALTFRTMNIISDHSATHIPLNNILWNVHLKFTMSRTLYFIRVLLWHLLPALIVDTMLWVFGKKPMLTKMQRRIYMAISAVQPFTTRQWTFDNSNFLSLCFAIKKQDRDQFWYDIDDVDLADFMRNNTLAGRRYLLKENDEDLPKAKTHYIRMWYLDKAVKVLFYGYLLWRLLNIFV